jgi:hypothetical protein
LFRDTQYIYEFIVHLLITSVKASDFTKKVDSMTELSTKQKIYIIGVAIVIGLVAFADGIALELINASSLFMYGAIIIAVATTITILALSFAKKRESTFQKGRDKPFFKTPKVPKLDLTTIQPTPIQTIMPKNLKHPEITAKKSEYTLPTKVSTQASQKPILKTSSQSISPGAACKPDVEKSDSVREEPKDSENGKLKCPSCSKEFSQPILMADYNNSNQPDLIAHCPYCFKPLGSSQKSLSDKESWKKYISNSA